MLPAFLYPLQTVGRFFLKIEKKPLQPGFWVLYYMR